MPHGACSTSLLDVAIVQESLAAEDQEVASDGAFPAAAENDGSPWVAGGVSVVAAVEAPWDDANAVETKGEVAPALQNGEET